MTLLIFKSQILLLSIFSILVFPTISNADENLDLLKQDNMALLRDLQKELKPLEDSFQEFYNKVNAAIEERTLNIKNIFGDAQNTLKKLKDEYKDNKYGDCFSKEFLSQGDEDKTMISMGDCYKFMYEKPYNEVTDIGLEFVKLTNNISSIGNPDALKKFGEITRRVSKAISQMDELSKILDGCDNIPAKFSKLAEEKIKTLQDCLASK